MELCDIKGNTHNINSLFKVKGLHLLRNLMQMLAKLVENKESYRYLKISNKTVVCAAIVVSL